MISLFKPVSMWGKIRAIVIRIEIKNRLFNPQGEKDYWEQCTNPRQKLVFPILVNNQANC